MDTLKDLGVKSVFSFQEEETHEGMIRQIVWGTASGKWGGKWSEPRGGILKLRVNKMPALLGGWSRDGEEAPALRHGGQALPVSGQAEGGRHIGGVNFFRVGRGD